MKAVLIFDDKCGVCSIFASSGFKKKVAPLGYSTKDAKRLMRAQFKRNYGFTLMMFTHDKVHWGPAAAKEMSRTEYIAWLSDMVHFIYPFIVGTLNILLRRKTPPFPPTISGRHLPVSGSMRITKAAYKEFNRIISEGSKDGPEGN